MNGMGYTALYTAVGIRRHWAFGLGLKHTFLAVLPSPKVEHADQLPDANEADG